MVAIRRRAAAPWTEAAYRLNRVARGSGRRASIEPSCLSWATGSGLWCHAPWSERHASPAPGACASGHREGASRRKLAKPRIFWRSKERRPRGSVERAGKRDRPSTRGT